MFSAKTVAIGTIWVTSWIVTQLIPFVEALPFSPFCLISAFCIHFYSWKVVLAIYGIPLIYGILFTYPVMEGTANNIMFFMERGDANLYDFDNVKLWILLYTYILFIGMRYLNLWLAHRLLTKAHAFNLIQF